MDSLPERIEAALRQPVPNLGLRGDPFTEQLIRIWKADQYDRLVDLLRVKEQPNEG